MYMLLSFIMLGLVTGQVAETPRPAAATGSEWVKELQSNYQEGKYKSFISEMDRYYQMGQTQNTWQPLTDKEKRQAEKYSSTEEKKKYEEKLAKRKQLLTEINQLKRERNQQLLKVAAAYPDAPISQVIKDLSNSELSVNELASLELLESWVASPIPLHAETPLLKQLKEINFETNAKYILLNAAYSQGDAQSKEIPYFGKLDEKKIEEYLVVLNLDRLNRMQKLAQKSDEQDLKEVISGVSTAFPTFIAQIYNNKTLEENVQNPANPAGQEAAKIIQSYNQKLIEAIKRFSPTK